MLHWQHIVQPQDAVEAKTPDAVRNASDQFFEWARSAPAIAHQYPNTGTAHPEYALLAEGCKQEMAPATVKRRL